MQSYKVRIGETKTVFFIEDGEGAEARYPLTYAAAEEMGLEIKIGRETYPVREPTDTEIAERVRVDNSPEVLEMIARQKAELKARITELRAQCDDPAYVDQMLAWDIDKATKTYDDF